MVETTQFNFRLTPEDKERWERLGRELGLSMADFVRFGLDLMSDLGGDVLKTARRMAGDLKLAVGIVIANSFSRLLAERAARETVWGPAPMNFFEFTVAGGRILQGKELFAFLLEKFEGDERREFRERAILLRAAGRHLSDRQKEVLERFDAAERQRAAVGDGAA